MYECVGVSILIVAAIAALRATLRVSMLETEVRNLRELVNRLVRERSIEQAARSPARTAELLERQGAAQKHAAPVPFAPEPKSEAAKFPVGIPTKRVPDAPTPASPAAHQPAPLATPTEPRPAEPACTPTVSQSASASEASRDAARPGPLDPATKVADARPEHRVADPATAPPIPPEQPPAKQTPIQPVTVEPIPAQPAAGAATPAQPIPTDPSHLSPASASRRPQKAASGAELHFTTKVAIWLGALALFLAGAFLVKYTFDQGLLGPGVRIALGAAFGLALIGAGEFMRRRSAGIAEGLAAAGVADLYAVILAGMKLYSFFGPTVGFGMLAAVTAAAIVLSLRQGPFVALLGLIGGFVTPALIGAEEPRPGPMFGYLFLLQCGVGAIARRRQWWWLSLLSFAGGIAWTGAWLLMPLPPSAHIWLAGFLLLSLGFMLLAGPDARQLGTTAARVVSVATSIAALVALGFVVRASGFGGAEWGMLALLVSASLFLAWRDPRHEPLPWLAFGLASGLLVIWRVQVGPVDDTLFPWVALGYGLLFGGGAYAAIWRSRAPARFATLSAMGGVAAVIIAYLALASPPAGVPWGVICVAAAAGYAVLALALMPVARRASMGDAPLAAMLVAVSTLVALAVPIEFERRLIPVAWAIQAALLALVFAWLRVHAARVLSVAVAAMAMVALVLPDVLLIKIGPTPIWNWLLYAYGVPAIAFAFAAVVFHRAGAAQVSRLFQIGAGLLVFLLVTLEVRHFFNRETLFAVNGGLFETSTHVSAWLVLALAAALGARGPARDVLLSGARATVILAMATAGLGLLLAQNPLWTPTALGHLPVLNALLPVYGLPMLLLFAVAYTLKDTPQRGLAGIVAGAGAVLLFALVSLETRHWFHVDLHVGRPSLLETAWYVIVWLSVALATTPLLRGAAEPVARHVRFGFGSLGLILAVAGLLIGLNPLLHPEPVGELVIVNWLLVEYGLPMLLLFALAATTWGDERQRLGLLFAIGGLLMLLALTGLQTRQWFHGPDLSAGTVSLRETAAYVCVWLSVALALTPLATSSIGKLARHAALGFAGVAGLFVALGLLTLRNPLFFADPVGETVVFNWLLPAYGLPLLLLLALAVATRRWPERFASDAFLTAAAVMLFALTTLEVRQGFQGANLSAGAVSLRETAAYVCVWLSVALALTPLTTTSFGKLARQSALAFAGVALVFVALGLLTLRNPLVHAEPVGEAVVFNVLLPAYGLPMLLLFALAAATSRWPDRVPSTVFRVASVVLLFALTTLEVRQWFRGPVLVGSFPAGAELYSYSATWIALGLALLAAGVMTGSLTARWASLVVMLLSVGKVFLIDTSHLKDLYRVVSLLGLGLSLMVLAFVYQKVVFKRSEAASTDPGRGPPSQPGPL